MVFKFRWQVLAALIVLGTSLDSLYAQVNTAFGSRSFGSGIQNNSSGGSSNFGQGFNTGGAGLGGSGFGTGGSSGLPTNYGNGSTGNLSGQTGTPGLDTAGQVQANARYLPENRQGAFVGADRGDTSQAFSQMQGAQQNMNQSNAFFSQLTQQMQRNQNQLNQQNRGGQQNRQQVRVSMKLGFTPLSRTVVVTPAHPMIMFQSRLERLPGLQLPAPVDVAMEEGLVVLRGRVATEFDRELVEGLARLEPGIEDVRNELVVDPAAATAVE